MIVVGLTGGIGSGKSTAAKFFSELQVPIIDADEIALKLTQMSESINAIVAYFGPSILNPAGQLNREKLKHLIFNDPIKKQWLERYLHPRIIEEIQKRLKSLSTPYCIVVAPLLFETQERLPFIDRILLIDADSTQQLERTLQRDKMDKNLVKSIIAHQIPRQYRLKNSQDVIKNTGDLEELKGQVKKVHDLYLKECARNNSCT